MNNEHPAEKIDFNYIADGIYIGANQCCQTHFDENLKKDGVSTVISMEEKRIDAPFGVEFYVWIPVKNHTAPTKDQLEFGVSVLEKIIAMHKKVYVHCQNGHGRAPTLVAALLIKQGKTIDEAIELIKSKRPSIHLADTQKDSLKMWEHNFKNMKNISIPISILIAAVMISGAILYSKQAPTSEGTSAAIVEQPNLVAGQQLGREPQRDLNQVSTDDDSVLGDKNAPLTIVEFSDYECPFCKRSFDQVTPELKKNYIDTGKVKLVYRDFPLSFHANAHKEAEAAECARSQSDDAAYFKFHDQIFTRTASNGAGLALSQLPIIARDLSLNVSQFQQCLDSGKFIDEVDKDIADGIAAGVSGTPSWFIGQSSKNGVIHSRLIVGAQPFSAFKTIIDEELNALGK